MSGKTWRPTTARVDHDVAETTRRNAPRTTAAGTRTVDLEHAPVGRTVAGGWNGLTLSRRNAAAATAVDVQVLSPAERHRLGLTGAAVRVTRTDRANHPLGIDVHISSSALAGTFGADYARRVTWRQSDGAATAGTIASHLTAIAQKRDTRSGVTTVTPAAKPSVLLVAASSSASSGGTGDFAATSLSPANSWQQSSQTGSFDWSYPLTSPPVAAGPEPDLSLAYDSGSIDGETGSTNNQTSAVGEGWNLTGSGFIERSYKSCSEDGHKDSGDECWLDQNASISFGGHSGHLVQLGSGNEYRLEDDDGSRVQRLTGADNGDGGDSVDGVGEHWLLTTTDGTRYYFGLGHVPSTKEATNGTWTAPIIGDDTGEPCHAATFAASACKNEAWRWNLDYVVDRHGLTESFFYSAETNRYALAGGAPVSYTRGGQLARIDYGTSTADAATAKAPARVVFTLASRCVTSSCTTHDDKNWPDVPWDLQCDTGTCSDDLSPGRFTTQRLTAIHSQVLAGSSYSDVDVWTLTHTFPDPGDSTDPALWLSTIGHTGYAADGTARTTPNTVLNKVGMPNRIAVIDGLPLMWKYRISSILTDTGASIAVTYSAQGCSSKNLPAPENNTSRCYPQWWAPDQLAPQLDWFNKYVVTQVTADPRTGGVSDSVAETDYQYTGTPGWRYDRNPYVPTTKRTWGDWAGYSQVTTVKGSTSDTTSREKTVVDYYQGLDGDRQNTSGGSKNHTVHASNGTDATDSLWFAGDTRETTVYNGNARVSNTINTSWGSAATATDDRYSSHMSDVSDTITKTALSSGGDRTTEVRTAFDARGRATVLNDLGDVATASDDRCTRTSYADNTTSWLLSLPSQVSVVGVNCSTTASYPNDAISSTRTYYDGHSDLADAPTTGNPTSTQNVDSYTGSTPHWQTTSTSTFDAIGRLLTVTDPRTSPARVTKSIYTPAGQGPLTSVATQTPDPLTGVASSSWQSVKTYNPRTGRVTNETDQNGHSTDLAYDPLGRLTGVWRPERPKSSNATPSIGYSYSVPVDSNNLVNGPLVTSTASLTPSGGSITGYQLADGLGRARQTQTPAPGGGRDVTDTIYDTEGRVSATNAPYYVLGNPGGTLFVPGTVVPGITGYTFDGAGRTTAAVTYVNGSEVWRTTTSYGGNHVIVQPPDGDTGTDTYADARGRTTEVRQFHSGITGAYDKTRYSYDDRGDMTAMVDNAGNTWTWTFDVLGRQLTAHDPDTGTTTNGYDPAGRLTSVTSAPQNGSSSNTVLDTTYDLLDRKSATYKDSVTAANKLASWTYDPSGHLGQPATNASYANGLTYTQTIGAYDIADRPTSTTVTIPADPSNATRNALAGSYKVSANYTANGLVQNEAHSAVGDIPAETISHDYDEFGHPTMVATGSVSYVLSASYTSLGELAQYTSAKSTTNYTRSFTYADGTRRLTRDVTTDSVNGAANGADHHYAYDSAGNLLQDQNTAATDTDTQCYDYDYAQRLDQAWTPASGTCGAAPTSSSSLGGTAPYWQSYSYDTAGDRTQIVRHAAGALSTDSTSNYSYPAAGDDQPHTLTGVTTTTGSAAPVTSSYQYDDAGNTITRPGSQSLTYDSFGHLASITTPTSSQSDIYDADGDRLIQTDQSGSTLYLGDTEAVAKTGGSTANATRTYRFGSTVVGERSGPGTWQWLFTNQTGTANLEINAGTNTLTRRHTDPFGNSRDGNPVTWSSSHGFLNAPTDPLGTTHLGAREYDPLTGRFTSADPVLNPSDPQSLNAYAYSDNDPIDHSDASGLCPPDKCGVGVPKADGTAKITKTGPVDPDNPGDGGYEESPDDHVGYYHPGQGKGNRVHWEHHDPIGRKGPDPRVPINFTWKHFFQEVWNVADDAAHLALPIDSIKSCASDIGLKSCGLAALDVAATACTFLSDGACSPAKAVVAARAAEAAGDIDRTAGAGERAAGAADTAAVGRDAAKSCLNSFTADTPVTLANGTQKPIRKVRVGDKVLATDPETGQTKAEPVVALIRHSGQHAMVLVTLADGSVLDATGGHKIWDATQGTFVHASQLRAGDKIETSTGALIAVASLTTYSAKLTAYNLQIDQIHTYYAGSTPVLVHNSCEPVVGPGASADNLLPSQASRIQAVADRFGRPVSVVGSRAAGTAGETSDWDYIIEGSTARMRSTAKYLLPRNPGQSTDILNTTLDPSAPSITFHPGGG